MTEAKQLAIADWVRALSLEQIPSVIVLLAARLVAEGDGHKCRQALEDRPHPDRLLMASELAGRLNLPESWVRNEARLGKLPSIRAGRYVRFRRSDAERVLSQRSSLPTDLD
jgi:hypothetical protein